MDYLVLIGQGETIDLAADELETNVRAALQIGYRVVGPATHRIELINGVVSRHYLTQTMLKTPFTAP